MEDLGVKPLEVSEETIIFNVKLAYGNGMGAVVAFAPKTINDIIKTLSVAQILDLPYRAAELCHTCGHMLTEPSLLSYERIIIKKFCAIKSNGSVEVKLMEDC